MLKDSKFRERDKAFTLIELLISISIVGIILLITLLVINPSALRAKARDSLRANNLKSIQAAIQLYYVDNKSYPLSSVGTPAWIKITGSDALSQALTGSPQYMRSVPLDPSQTSVSGSAENPCDVNVSNKPDYRFNYLSDGSYYLLTAQAESLGTPKGKTCSSLSLWGNSSCSGVNANCFGLEGRSL